MLNLDGSQVNLLIAFIGGIVTFFASCLLPLVPIYLAYLSGITLSDTDPDKQKSILRKKIFINSFFFVVGFILIFILFGATVNTIGRLLVTIKPIIQKIGGVFFIIMGLFMLRIIKPIFLVKEKKISLPQNFTKWQKLNSFLVGITFGFAWTPCIGPVLAVIIFWASQANSLWQGMGLLFAYGIGMGLPFLLIGLFFEYLSSKINKISKATRFLHKLAAVFILLIGIFLLIGKMEWISLRLLDILNLSSLSV